MWYWQNLFVCKRFKWTKASIFERENVGKKQLSDPNALIDCSNAIDDVYENIDDYNLSRNRERKKIIFFGDMIADIIDKRRIQAILKEFFIRCRKYFTCFYHSILFFCPKRCHIIFNILLDYENKQQKRITKYYN